MTSRLSCLPDLPPSIVSAYHSLGIQDLFPWQLQCLTSTQALQGGNLVYNAPTSGGKTLISELILILRYLRSQRKSLFVVPYISIVLEKTRCFSRVMKSAGLKIRAFCSNKADRDLSRTDVAICTIEKANRLLTRAIDEGNSHEIGLIIVDELHMLNEGTRGALLESLLTKALYIGGVQIVGMSATLPNIHEIAVWLKAEHFESGFRPVPLKQYTVQRNAVYSEEWVKERTLEYGKGLRTLVSEVKSCIVFCPTRLQAQKTAAELAKSLDTFPGSEEVLKALERLDSESGLLPYIPQGIAYHHSGLTDEEKQLIEDGFKSGKLRILTATSTLAAGVNLPAQRVIITHINMGGEPLGIGQYRQMCGRAGRTGCDVAGDSYVFIDTESKSKALELMNGSLPPVKSALNRESLKQVVLEIVCTGLCKSRTDIGTFMGNSLYAVNHTYEIDLNEALAFLIDNHIIEDRENNLKPTLLGLGLLASALSPEEGFAVFLELDYASKRVCLLSDLYLIYLSCPVFPCINPNYRLYLSLLVRHKETAYFRAIMTTIGISEDFICQSEIYPPGKLTPSHLVDLRSGGRSTVAYKLYVHTRFYTALILWTFNSGAEDVSDRFHADKGSIQSLQRLASTYLSLVINLCNRLNWWQFEALFRALRDRALYMDQSDLQPLLTIPGVDVDKARILAGAGLETIGKVAKAPVTFLTQLFQKFCLPEAVSAAVAVSTNSRKRFAAVFLSSKRRRLK